MHVRKKAFLCAFAALFLIGAATVWYTQHYKARGYRIVLDDTTSTIRLEAISKSGTIRECRRELLDKNNPSRQRAIILWEMWRVLKSNAACTPRYGTEKCIIRADENTSAAYVFDVLVFSLKNMGAASVEFEIVGQTGEQGHFIITDSCGMFRSDGICIDIHNQKNLLKFLKAEFDCAQLNKAADAVAFLRQKGVEKVSIIHEHAEINSGNVKVPYDGGKVFWAVKFSRYTRMGDLLAVHSKLSAVGVKDEGISYLQMVDSCIEVPGERE